MSEGCLYWLVTNIMQGNVQFSLEYQPPPSADKEGGENGGSEVNYENEDEDETGGVEPGPRGWAKAFWI